MSKIHPNIEAQSTALDDGTRVCNDVHLGTNVAFLNDSYVVTRRLSVEAR
jgi:hypothetical protein